MITAKPEICPSGSAAQPLILNDGRVLQQIVLATLVLQPFVSAQPDAIPKPIHFALSLSRAAARAIALVFRALRFGTQKRNVRQRTVTAIPAMEKDCFTDVLQCPHRLWPL